MLRDRERERKRKCWLTFDEEAPPPAQVKASETKKRQTLDPRQQRLSQFIYSKTKGEQQIIT